MAMTNRDRVNRALELLYEGLHPYVVREMKAVYKTNWISAAQHALNTTLEIRPDGEPHLDTASLLRLIFDDWHNVFKKKLGHTERSIVSACSPVGRGRVPGGHHMASAPRRPSCSTTSMSE